MRIIHRLLVPIGFLSIAFPMAIQAQAVLTGTVRQDSSRTPLAGVEVLIEGTNLITTTDAAGRYRLVGIPVGNRVVLLRLVGYRPYREQLAIQNADTTIRDVVLRRIASQVLDSIEVTGRATRGVGLGYEGLEERRALGFGKFVDQAELRRSEHRKVADLLRGMQGIRIVRSDDKILAASGRGATSMIRGAAYQRDEYCFLSIYLDGRALYQSGDPPVKRIDLARDIQVSDLQAIEVYRSAAEVPGAYSGTAAACGVILLWSRKGR